MAAGLSRRFVNGLILFEDEHLLAVNKPSGINTHKPDRCAPDGIHEWLTKHWPPTARLSVLHGSTRTRRECCCSERRRRQTSRWHASSNPTRLKKGISFSRQQNRGGSGSVPNRATPSPSSNSSNHTANSFSLLPVRSRARPTRFERHAADNGFPILGDARYGGDPAPRLMLHAHRLAFEHPTSRERITLEASVPAAFEEADALVAAAEFRELMFDEQTNAYRLINGSVDGYPDVIVDSYAGHLLVQWQTEAAARNGSEIIGQLKQRCRPRAIYEQLVTRQRRTPPQLAWGSFAGGTRSRSEESAPAGDDGPATAGLPILENRLQFLVNFGEGLSTGLFLDQRENRRRLLTMDLAGKTVLNCFSYTCAFSVAAAKAGAVATSIDLSRRYLGWGSDNFRVNGLNPDRHRFLVGDVFEWLKRFQKRSQTWDIVILDPPTFATTKKGRAFQATRDYEELAALAMGAVVDGGTLLCSTNQRTLTAEQFETSLRNAAALAGRVIGSADFETLPFDFRVGEGEQPYLKTFWVRIH